MRNVTGDATLWRATEAVQSRRIECGLQPAAGTPLCAITSIGQLVGGVKERDARGGTATPGRTLCGANISAVF